LNELYNLLQEAAQSSLKPNYGPDRAGDIQDSLADISKIETLLHYKPTIRIKEGLALTLEWFRNAF
jgi:UDP-N-acetylglucosamine 4-epimerase